MPRRSSRCDFVDGGLCHESPRWVSLLVAEIFYPHAVFPTSSPQRRRAPHPAAAQPPSPYYPHPHPAPLLQQQQPPPPSVGDFHAFQQYLHRRVGADQQQALSAQKQRPQEQRLQQQQQQSKRRSDGSPAGPRAAARSRSSSSSSSTTATSSSKDKCDGYDHVGCYIVRMYYDWFLVNGSCKCWKPSAKHVFTGGRR